MNSLQRIVKASALACGITLSIASLHAINVNLDEAGGYNLVTWGDATLKNSDTEGRVAVGGNATFGSYSVGYSSTAGDPARAQLTVGGNLDGSGGGQVYNGSIYVGGNYTSPGYNLHSAAGSTTQSNLGKGNLPFNFDAAQAALLTKSTDWGALSATGSSTTQWGTLTLEGNEDGLNIFNIDAATLAAAHTFEIFVPTGAKALINVSGAVAEMSNMGFFGTHTAQKTLFNFFEATQLDMVGIGVTGSILAPLADLSFTSGNVDGQVIVNSFQGAQWGSGEMHDVIFEGDPNSPAPIPDTGSTLALIATALVGIVAVSRKLKG
ncbi:VPDSG-CTERM sorting domain-containing protein [Pelagicoccus enzymogenes]|uniref:VPDSG-CTERM sorting domain-containing protein n=1 Tax=Pelagicoccus enzymogenes TaxID=2773457 RepID=UPI00280E961E|nr:VPDSG-CTERM sorting domain-containing protein [Pelagicoccus enzymogenes]MDQ8198134.1 VPDSG-CTERM sorting domain-containing protein [Pelagicoccus enzymogenes]